MKWYERHWRWLAGGIVLVTVVIGLSLVSPVWHAGTDAVKYMDSARSLARGDGYLFNGGPEAKHAPGFPVLLVPFFWITSDPFLLTRIMTVLTAGVALYLAGTILRRELGPGVSLAALGCVALSVQLWWSTQLVLSEHPFTLLQNLGLILLLRLANRETQAAVRNQPKTLHNGRSPRKRDALLFGLIGAAAILTRSTAVALLAACAYVILRRCLSGKLTTARAGVVTLFAFGTPIIAFAAWRTYTAICAGAAMPENFNILLRRGFASDAGGSYAALVAQTAGNLLSHGGGLFFGDIIPSQYPTVEPFLWVAMLLIWLPVAIALVVRGLWRAEPVWAFLCAYICMILVWPLAAGATARLCWPVAPFIAGLLLSSYRWLAGRIWLRRGPLLVSVAILAGVLIGQIPTARNMWPGTRAAEAFWSARLADLARVRDRFHPAPPAVWAHLNVRAAVYVFDMPTTVMEFSWSKNPEKWACELDNYEPDYIVVPTTPLEQENARRFVETLTRVRPRAKRVAELETVSLYHIPRTIPKPLDLP